MARVDSPLASLDIHHEVWGCLEHKGYVLISDLDKFGFGSNFRAHLGERYFSDGDLLAYEHYSNVFPPDRERARDVVSYLRNGSMVEIHEHHTTAIGARSYDDRPDEARIYNRFFVTHDAIFRAWLQFVLSLVPPRSRDIEGTVGVNLFRTHSSVVNDEKPHQDDEQWVGIFLRDKLCDGAETVLYESREDGTARPEPTFRAILQAGDFFFFDDQRFHHKATKLVAPTNSADVEANQLFRETVIVTVDKPSTYLFDHHETNTSCTTAS
jgi:hypothetical protein